MSKGGLLILAAVLAWAFLARDGAAQTPVPGPEEGQPPILFSADELSYDREMGVTRAAGRVEVSYAERILLADVIAYNERLDLMTASGNVSLVEPSGDVLFAEYMELSGDLKEGILEDFRAILADGARLAAGGARRSGGVRTEMSKAVYSPCDLCPEDPTAAPLWQIKAIKVVHDEEAKRIEYTDAWIELAGVPVAYAPYFSHPDPRVKRKTGFLVPSIGNSSDLGFVAEAPFFWAINPHQDATIRPIITSGEGPVLATEYRARLMDGTAEANGSITRDSDKDVRGHISGRFRYDLDDTWRMGADVERTLDDTYLRRYGFGGDRTLTSRLFAEGFSGRSYIAANTYLFQSLENDVNDDTLPLVLPALDYNFVGRPDRWGGRTELDLNLLALTRDEGVDVQRLSAQGGWQLPLRGGFGDVLTFRASIQADLYHVEEQPISGRADNFDGFTGRVFPRASLDWRLPFVRGGETVHQVLEPIAQVVVAPNGGNPAEIPNEDSQDFELDETNLFGENRFTGVDRVEGGTRFNYGLRWGAYGAGGGSTTVFVGQSYRLNADDTFASGSGLEDNLSDVVAAVAVTPGRYVNLSYRTRFDAERLTVSRHEVSGNGGIPEFFVSGSYVFFASQTGSELDNREELSLSASLQITDYWRIGVSGVRDLTVNGGQRSMGGNVTYEDECLIFTAKFTRTFFVDRDLEPTDAVFLRVLLKTLGEFGTES